MKKVDRSNVADILRLTPMQEGILYHHLWQPGGSYFEQICLHVEGVLRPDCFDAAWRRVTAGHEALRTVFRWEGIDHPVQIILRQHEPALSTHALPPGADAGEFLAELKRNDRDRGFDFEQVPFRVALCRLGERHNAVLLSNHHILLDGWSTGLILRDFLQHYRALADGTAPPAAPPRCAMKDLVRSREQPDAGGAERFWRDYLRGVERGACFGRTVQAHDPGSESCELRLDDTVLGDLRDLAASFNVTAPAVLHTAWGLLLQKYADSDDVVFGTVESGRDAVLPGLLETAGLLIHTLPLRFRSGGNVPLSKCMQDVHAQMTARAVWQGTPLSEIRRCSGLPAGEDLFDTLLVIENYPLDKVLRGEGGALRIAGHDVFERTHYAVTLTVEAFDGLHLSLAWRDGVLDRAAASRLLQHFAAVLSYLVRFPRQTVAELDLLTSPEREQVFGSFNRTSQDFRESMSVADLVGEQAARSPDRCGLICGDDALTYGQLMQRAGRVAAELSDGGLPQGGVVAVSLPPCSGLIVGLLGIMAAGGAYLPLDASFPEQRNGFILADSGAGFMIDAGPDGSVSVRPLHPPVPVAGPASAAYLLYTSGSTGHPKGVWVSHRNLANFLGAMRQALPVQESDVFLSLTTVSFDIFGLETWLPLSMGCTVVLGTREQQLDAGQAAACIGGHGVSVYQVTPSRLRLQLENADFRSALGRLRILLIGGEMLPADLLRQVKTLTGARIFNLYGPTETTIWSTVSELTQADQPDIGHPIANTSVYILARTGSVQPPGLAGELCIGGEGVALGYHHRDALTAARFREVGALGRLYCTGDLAQWSQDGRLVCLGRMDDQLKIRGMRIEPGEIESVLTQHSGVQDAVVVSRMRADEPALAAFWIAAPDSEVSAASLKTFLAGLLPANMIPATFVRRDAMPLTGNGKIARQALPNPFEQVAVARPAPAVVSETGRKIAEIWRQVLRIEYIGPDIGFFQAGGDSFGLIRLHGKLAAAFGKKLSVTDLFRLTTVRQQAAHIAGDEAVIAAPPPRRARAGADIAVIGMAGRFPGAPDIDTFWEMIQDGREGLRHFSETELLAEGIDPRLLAHPDYVRVKGCLDDADAFDAAFFGVTPKDAESMDPQIRQLAQCAWEALEDAGHAAGEAGSVGLFVGSSANYHWLEFVGLPDATTARFDTLIRNEKDYLATRVAYMLNLTGPALTVQTACSTSLVAIDLAAQALLSGNATVALAGGIGLTYPLRSGYLHEEGMIFSPDGHCRPFDAAATGTVSGNGVGIVVLKLLEDAIADGDHIRAVVKGIAVNNDGGAKVGFTAPSVDGQARAIAQAHRAADVDPETIGYVETHGSATPLGDPIEVAALTRAFASQRTGFCALGSVKANVGHLDAAAGVAGFARAVLALQHRTLPPSVHFTAPNPAIDFRATPFFVNAEVRPWPQNGHPRRAGVSSFGIGGTNAHAVLQEAPDLPPRVMPAGPNLLLLSARTPEQLQAQCGRLASHVERHDDLEPADLAFTLHGGRKRFAYRRALVCKDLRQAAAALAAPFVPVKAPDEKPPVVFLFGGLGAQYPGMCAGLYESEPGFRDAMDQCFDLLRPALDLKSILFAKDSPGALQEFGVAQAAIFACEYALARMLIGWGIRPAAVAGYSFGEYTAACIAGVLSLEDAIAIVAERGRLLGDTAPGAMLSVPLPAAEVAGLLTGSLALAVDNGPSCLVAGLRGDVAGFAAAMKQRRVWTTPLDGDRAMHSPVVRAAARGLQACIARCRRHEPTIPLVSNLTGDYFAPGEALDDGYWSRHLCETVRFADTLRTLLRLPDAVFVEIGPGRDLLGLLQHQDAAAAARSVHLVRHVQDPVDDRSFLLSKLGALFIQGVEADAGAFNRDRQCRRVSLPGYPFERQRYWPQRAGKAGPALNGTAPVQAHATNGLLYLPVWKQARRLGDAAVSRSRWLLLSDGGAFAAALAGELMRQGQDVVVADAAAQRLSDGPLPDHIVHLRTLTQGAEDPMTGLDRVRHDGFHHLLDLARDIGERGSDHRVAIHLVTDGAAEINGEGGLRPEAALLQGPVRVIPFEYPNLTCRLIDIRLQLEGSPDEQALVQALITECVQTGAPKTIALRGRLRWETVHEALPAPAADGAVRFRDSGVYLITGGFGALALALARRLAERWRARLVLVGRKPPAAETFADIERHGEVISEAADVTDPAALRAVVQRCLARFGAIHGVFHLAGTADGALIQSRSRDQSDRVLAPKTRGMLALDAALRGATPDFLVLFSSINSIVAPYGQVAYASANAFLDSFALARHRPDCFTVSINWDTWKQAGMAVATRPAGTGELDEGLSTAEGLDLLETVLRGCEPRVAVSMTELSARLAQHERDGGVPVAQLAALEASATVRARPELIVAYAPADNGLEQKIGGVLQEYLRLERVGIDDNFNDLGASSLDLIQIAQRLKRALQRDVAVVDLYRNPTVRGIARRLGPRPRVDSPEPIVAPAIRDRSNGLRMRREMREAARASHE